MGSEIAERVRRFVPCARKGKSFMKISEQEQLKKICKSNIMLPRAIETELMTHGGHKFTGKDYVAIFRDLLHFKSINAGAEYSIKAPRRKSYSTETATMVLRKALKIAKLLVGDKAEVKKQQEKAKPSKKAKPEKKNVTKATVTKKKTGTQHTYDAVSLSSLAKTKIRKIVCDDLRRFKDIDHNELQVNIDLVYATKRRLTMAVKN